MNCILTKIKYISGSGGFEHYQTNIDPEELFKNIFGSAGFNMSGFGNFNDFAESQHGFAAASEVSLTLSEYQS